MKKLSSFLLFTGIILQFFCPSFPYFFPISIIFFAIGVIMLYRIKDDEIAEEKRLEKEKAAFEKRKQMEEIIDFENQKFLFLLDEMCWDWDFDTEEARKLAEKADVSKFYLRENYLRPLLLLETAVEARNINMVKLLLENGADPNANNYDGENIFSDMIYLDYYDDEEADRKLEIIKLMLDYGADPCYDDGFEYENLFDTVACRIFNRGYEMVGSEFRYLSTFFTLLIIYGGKSNYRTLEIVEEFDKSDVFQYHFEYTKGYYKENGIIKDRDGKIFAYI